MIFKEKYTQLEWYIIDCSEYKQAKKYVSTIKRTHEYLGEEYKQGGDTISTLKNENQFTITLPKTTQTTKTTTVNDIDTMMF